jgi:hypothetical protein
MQRVMSQHQREFNLQDDQLQVHVQYGASATKVPIVAAVVSPQCLDT